jgi:hypothetical protein
VTLNTKVFENEEKKSDFIASFPLFQRRQQAEVGCATLSIIANIVVIMERGAKTGRREKRIWVGRKCRTGNECIK